MKRLVVYLTYSPKNVVEDYVGYMLKELRKISTTLIVICNEESVLSGEEHIKKFADKYYFRKNIGLDAGGFKDALTKFIGWDEVKKYDELVMANDSFFGPFTDIEEFFADAEAREGDFWGLIKHGNSKNVKESVAEHIQSFFIAIRSSMFNSDEFQKYWNEMPYYNDYSGVVNNHEKCFTKTFHDLGYSYFTMANTDINDSENPKFNQNQYAAFQYELIKKRNFPFLKRQELGKDISSWQTSENIQLALDYIDKNTEYDVGLIYKSVAGAMDLRMLQRTLCLNYILDESDDVDIRTEETAIILFAQYRSAVEDVDEALMDLKKQFDVLVCTGDLSIAQLYKNKGYECIIGHGFLEVLKKYAGREYLCLMSDVDLSGKNEFISASKSTLYNYTENLIKSPYYCGAVIRLFMEKDYLGALIPPLLLHASNFEKIRWNEFSDADQLKKDVERLKLKCVIDNDAQPMISKNCLWLRGEVLRHLFEKWDERWTEIKIDRLWQYIVQDAGFCIGQIQSRSYAEMYGNYMSRFLSMAADYMENTDFGKGSFDDIELELFKGKYFDFRKKYSKIYVYGTGLFAIRYADFFKNVEAYVVSDGQRKTDEFNGKKVYELSEVDFDKDTGVVICTGKKMRKEIRKLLNERGISSYVCVQG